jgi:hypothetical protein
MVTQKPMVRSGGDRAAARVLHVHDAIPLDTERADARAVQPFTGHRLYGISPNLRNLHGPNSSCWGSDARKL